MEHITAKKNRLMTTLLTMLFAVVIFCCALFAGFGFGATAEGGSARAAYKYELKTVSVSFNDGWIFTANTPDSALYKMVSVTVTYQDNDGGDDVVRTLQVTDNKATTGETVAFTRNTTAKTVTATVTPSGSDYDPASKSGTSTAYTLSNADQVVLSGITAEYHPTGGFVPTTATNLDDDFMACITVHGTYNDGSVNLNGTVNVSYLDGDLFPSVLTSAIIDGTQKYSKDITVFADIGDGSDAKTVSTTVLITGITFARPDDMSNRISGNIQRQVARSKQLNVDGLTIDVYYDTGAAATVPLSVFPSNYIIYKCKDASDNEVKDAANKPILSTLVKKIEVTFNYPDVGTTQTRVFNSSVSRISIHTPIFPGGINSTKTTVAWNEGASVDITAWDFDGLYTENGGIAPELDITIDKYNMATGVTGSLSSAELSAAVGAVTDDTVSIDFPAAGYKYTINVILSDDGDFMWGSPFNGNKADNMTMTYEVQVDKGQPIVTLGAIADTIYGTPNDDGSISDKIKDPATGNEIPMGKSWTAVAATASNTYANDDNAWHYSLSYYTAYTSATVNTPVAAADLNAYGTPKNVGTYYAVATTYENGGYKSAVSNAVSFKVQKYTINTTIPSKTFARTDWTINDFILPNDITKGFPYSDTALGILNVTDSSNNAVTAATKFRHANDYALTVEIKNDATAKYRDNYELTGKKTSDTVTVTIETNENSTFDFTATGWLYGTSGANPNINITSKSATYYPSKTGTLSNDYTVKYYKYDGTKPNNKGDEVTITVASDLEKLEVGRYVIELTANQNAADGDGNETAALVAGTEVDYTLPVVLKDFMVTASPIVAPYLDTTATDWTTPDETTKLLYTFDDTKDGKEYEFKSWIGDGAANTAADGSAIITVTITYVTYKTSSTETVTGFAGGKFKVNYAGDYTVTVTLNPNYSWQTKDGSNNDIWYPTDGSGNAVYTYSYQGYVAKQQLTVLTNGNISGAKDAYDSTSQNKTITSWNEKALTITSVTVGGLETGHTPVSGGITLPDDATPTNERNIFGVTNAGKYTVKVDIADQDNYEWAGATTDTEKLRQLSLEYTLNRAPMIVTWSNGTKTDYNGTFAKTPNTEYPRFEFDGTKTEQTTPEAIVNVFDSDKVNIDIDGYTLYNDANGAFGSTLTKVENVGHYRIVVSAISGTAAPNYYLPENGAEEITNIATIFEIYAKTFDRPTLVECSEVSGTAIEVVYKGTGYRLSDFIQYFNDNYYFPDDKLNNVLRLDIKYGEDGTNNPLLKDVLWNDDKTQIIAYEINVKPADNYAWATGEPNDTIKYTIKITQKTVNVSWGVTKFETTYGEVNEPTPTVDNAETGDTVNITLGYKQGNTAVADITAAAAGKYTVYAASLDNLNYQIDGEKADYSIPFTIKKKALAKPTFAGLSGAEFGGSATTTSDLYSNNAADKGAWQTDDGMLFTAAVTAKLDKAWFTEAVADNAAVLTIDTTDNAKYAFDTATGKLTYYAAGIYTVTFSLTDSANYCWADDGKESAFDDTGVYTFAWNDNITVNRKEIAAPALGNQRAMERDNPNQDKQLNKLFDGTIDGVAYGVQYGARDGAGFGAPQAEQPEIQIGQYYVLLSATDKYNYTWTVEPDGEGNTFAKSSYINPQIDGKVYKTEYTVDGGARVYLLYAITATQLNVDLVVHDYTYGANGFAVNGILNPETSKWVVDYTNVNGENKVFEYQNHHEHEGEGYHLPEHKNPAYIFYKIVGNSRELVDDAELVEGLPWEAGDYEAEITISFESEEEYEPWTDTRSFKVEKRTLTLEWTFGEGDDEVTKDDGDKFTTEYTGEEQKPTPRITNIPQKTAADVNPAVPNLTIAAQTIAGKTAFIDAATYTVNSVSFADNAAANDNYDFGEYTLYFEITPKDVTLTATAQSHTYGDELIFAASDCLDDDTKAQFHTRDGLSFIVMQVKDGDGTVLTNTLDVVYGGTYTLVPLFDADNVSSENYKITATTAAALNVQKRAITVTVTNNPTSVYSEAIADISYTVALTSGGEGSAVVDTESDVFTIAALSDGNAITNKTDVGDYSILLTLGERAGNYDITFSDSYKYSITKKQIVEKKDGEGNDTIVANALTYNGDNQKFLKDGFAVVIGNDEIAANAPVWSYTEDGTTWKTFTQSPTVKDAGTYNFIIKVTAKNHTDLTKNVTVTVGKAELTVKFDLAIMIGEEDPASVSYMFGLDHLRTLHAQGTGWTVTGFMGADRTLFYTDGANFYNLAGKAEYTVDGYNKAATTTSTHAIGFIATEGGNPTLTCDNYTFVGEVGTLTVNKVGLTVNIKDNAVEYNKQGEYNIPDVNVQGVGYTVDMPKSTYSDSESYIMSESYAAVFTISTTAHDEKVGTSTTGKVGSYAISGTPIAELSGKYDITFVGGWDQTLAAAANGTCGKYTITPATLTVKPAASIEDYSKKYDEKWHGIIVDGVNTVRADGTPTSGITFADASDGTTVAIEYGYNNTPKKLSKTEFDKLTTLSDNAPAFRDVGTYYVHYCLTNPNYTTVLDYRTVTIEKSNNGLSVAFDFENNSVVLQGTAIPKAAWTYGYKAEGGFDPDGANKVIEPEATFKYAGGSTVGKITFQLFYADDEDSLLEKEVDADAADTVMNMFKELFAGNGLNAGNYRLNVSMATTPNYVGFSVDYVFTVAKRALTVKAEVPAQIQYGSVVPAFTDNSAGLVVNSSKAGATADSIADALGAAPVYATAYTQGKTVGDYRVYANGKSDGATDTTSFTNYTVTYADVQLTVVPREITVNIADKENTYNLKGQDATEEVRTLTFTVTDGSIYTAEQAGGAAPADGVYNNSNQTVLTLYTEAIIDGNTNNVKFDGNGNVTGYTIYAEFCAGAASTNYNVNFAGCSNKESKTTAIGYDGSADNAGSYTIKKAIFGVKQYGVYHNVNGVMIEDASNVYSGAVNYYRATLDDKDETRINFTYTKKDSSGNYVAINANQVIGVGEYQAIGRSDNPNYTAADLNIGFTIVQATLTLTADSGKRVQYGTTLSGSVATDNAAGGAVATGRFDGFTYKSYSPTLLATTLTAYLNNNTVGYAVVGYDAKTRVGASNCKITPTCASDANVNVECVGADLSVIKRAVTVTMVGWDEANKTDPSKHNPNAWTYYLGTHGATHNALVDSFAANISSYIYFADSKVVFGDSGDGYAALGITVNLPDGVDVGEHVYAYNAANNTNYNVTFANTSPKYSVQKAKLTLYAKPTKNSGYVYSNTYGETIETFVERNAYNVGALTYFADGMQGNDEFMELLGNRNIVFTIVDKDGKAYVAWDSSVGNYTVSLMVQEGENMYAPTAATFTNYEIVSVVGASLNLKQRKISASTQHQTFGFDEGVYNGGLFGKNHNAVITFADAVGRDDNQVDSAYRPAFTLSYNTVKKGTYQAAGAAPTFVGKYEVTVTLGANSNYVFDNGTNSSTLKFNVNKLEISEADLDWNTVSYSMDTLTEETFTNYIERYVDDYFRVVRFVYTSSTGVGTQITAGDKDTLGTYYIDNQKMFVTFGRDIGMYTISFVLKDSAKGNLTLSSNIADEINVSFEVRQDKVTITVEMADFIYGSQPSKAIVMVNDSEATDGLTLTYAPVTSANAAQFAQNSFDNQGLESVTGLTYGALSSATNFNAGYYLLSAAYSYNGIIARRYYVFNVAKRVITAPQSSIAAVIYNGSAQNVVIDYETAYMRPELTTAGGSMTAANGKATFTATSVGTYNVRFILIDPANNVWDTNSATGNFSDQTLTLAWNITKDETTNGAASSAIVALPSVIDDIAYGGAFNPNSVTIKNGYNGTVTLYRMPKTDDNAPAADTSTEGWTAYNTAARSLDAGEYWLKVVVTDLTGRNFTPKATVGSFRIVPKTITASVSGSMIYGTKLADTNFDDIVITGLLYGYQPTIGAYSYDFAEAYANYNADGAYEIILNTDENDAVIGIDAGSNYIVKAARGTLTITKRAVTVTIESKSSDYSVTPVLSDVQYMADGLADGEDKSVLGIVFETDATAKSAAGGTYWITVKTYDGTNYEVTQHRALYVINPLEIEVELVRQENITYGDNNIKGATAGDIKIANTDADEEFVIGDLQLVIRFTGSNGYDSYDVPTDAGSYTATLVGANSNYRLIGTPSIDFAIDKKEVDVTAFFIQSATYTGDAITPRVDVKQQGSKPMYGPSIYVMTACTFIDAGNHDVTVSLADPANYAWSSTSDASVTLTFTINRASDKQTANLVIKGWQYGCYDAAVNSPSAAVASGESIVYQYSADGKTYTNIVPENGNAGTYYVRVYVAQSQNYLEFVGTPVSFKIDKFVVAAPSLSVVTEGDGKNDVYTGDNLASGVIGFNPQLMQIAYDGNIQSLGDAVTVFARDAGTYTISVSLFNAHNYCWNTGDDDNDGTLVLTWSVARKKIAKPTHDSSTKIVNGNTIIYIPVGFDSSIMSIENNAYSYGGTFGAKITLKDTKNYEWATGDDKPFTIKWSIVGADTVFTVIIVVLSILAVAAAALIVVQYLLNRHRKRMTASTMQAIEESAAKSAAEQAATENAAESATQQPEAENKPEQPAEEQPETEQPQAEQPAAETSEAEQPQAADAAEAPKAEQAAKKPAAKKSTAKKSTTANSTAKKPATKKPTTAKSTTAKSTTAKKPTTKKPAAKKPTEGNKGGAE